MANKLFSISYWKSYWGLNWKKNLLNKEDKARYSQNRLTVKENDLKRKDYEAYVQMLDNIIDDEKQRLEGIENKATQIVGQASIVIAVLGFFSPAILDKIPSEYIIWRIIFVGGILLISLLFLYAIICALRNYNIQHYEFAKMSERNIVDHNNNVFSQLRFEIVNDKIFEMRVARHSTNAKASNVLYASRVFKAAIFVLVFYILFYAAAVMILPEQIQKVEIVQPKKNVTELLRK